MKSTRTIRQAKHHLANVGLAGVDTVIALAAGAMGALVAHDNTGGISGEWRITIMGAAAVVAAVNLRAAVRSFLMPRRRRVSSIAGPEPGHDTDSEQARDHAVDGDLPPLPASLNDRLALLADREREFTAAMRAYRLDPTGVWLTVPARWQALHGGATMVLADGYSLTWHEDAQPYTCDEFTVSTPGSSSGTAVTSARELREYVTAHPAYSEPQDKEPV